MVGFIMSKAVECLLRIISILYSAFAVSMLWSWFIVPFGVVPINTAWAIGLACIAVTIQGFPEPKASRENDFAAYYDLSKPFLATGLALLVGFVAHLFM
ncbi:TPA: hypothetical protein ND475_003575 [Escherichia coli]|nr:hypothetical protein [Escherichia coli]